MWIRCVNARACTGLALILVLSVLSSCGMGEQAVVEALEVTELVTYWSVEGKRGDKNYIHPILRFRIRNGGEGPADYVQTLAVFRLESSPDDAWGNAYEYSIAGEAIAPGQVSKVITLRSDSTFFSKDEPKKMMENEEWEQVWVEIFLRVGSSDWIPVTKVEVPRRLGAPGVERFLEPPEEDPQEAPQLPEGKSK